MQEDEDTSQISHESHVTLMPKPDKDVTRTKDRTKKPQTTIPHGRRCKSYRVSASPTHRRPDRSLTPGDQGGSPGRGASRPTELAVWINQKRSDARIHAAAASDKTQRRFLVGAQWAWAGGLLPDAAPPGPGPQLLSIQPGPALSEWTQGVQTGPGEAGVSLFTEDTTTRAENRCKSTKSYQN